MGDILVGKKTYALVILGLVSAFALYVQHVVQGGFNVPDLLNFLNGEAVMAAIGTLRLAIAKK